MGPAHERLHPLEPEEFESMERLKSTPPEPQPERTTALEHLAEALALLKRAGVRAHNHTQLRRASEFFENARAELKKGGR
jgi:hypothetical protein